MSGKDDVERLHQDEDLKAVGLNLARNAVDGFRNHALLHNSGGGLSSTHSIGIRPHPRGGVIAKSLLAGESLNRGGTTEHPLWRDPRPLIDKVQEATFGNTVGMQWVADKYALRMLLRKAHCFTLDPITSGMVTQFSVAVGYDIEAARHLAVPPFPTTWFQLDNPARLKTAKDMGIGLTPTAAGLTDGPPVPDVGWLIVTTGPDEYAATYICVTDVGVFVAPTSFCWTTAHEPAKKVASRSKEWLDRLVFGMRETNCHIDGAWLGAAPYQRRVMTADYSQAITQDELELMAQIAGETRHIFGLLVALGAGQLGAQAAYKPQEPPAGPPVIMKGKPLLPLEHKVLTIKLAKRMTVERVAIRAIAGVKKRWHEVRSHFRVKYNADGSVRWRIPIKSHTRGDERLGRVEKTYRVQK